MNDEVDFIEQILQEAEQKEMQQTNALVDLILLQISKWETQIAANFEEQEKEILLIKEWTLTRNSKLQDQIDLYAKKCEAYLKELNLKSLSLPHGSLQLRKLPDRIEILDQELFLKSASRDLLKIVPAIQKPDLLKIKTYIKNTGKTPEGVRLISGEIQFNYKINSQLNEKEN
ncbi:MAG: hypothetical protein DAHOPDDO_00605 [Ignavibacteriaceae bacterium]|nr:hypothetical protein [Ignavibacteriaceae bacterium]